MDRLFNYIFLLILVYVFALWAPTSIHGTILVGIIVSVLFCGIAFIFRWLTLDGAAAATVIGIITFGLGGWPTIIALLSFFISSALISITDTGEARSRARRNGPQVWANGFWIVWWLLAGIMTNFVACWMAASAAIATATADTWATELGSERFSARTYLASGFKQVPAGSEGGISGPGLVAALAGSSLIAAIAWYGFAFSIIWFICIWGAGFAGSLFDSYLGATLQGTQKKIQLARLNWSKEIVIDNNTVNWLATGFGSFLILILNLIFYEMV